MEWASEDHPVESAVDVAAAALLAAAVAFAAGAAGLATAPALSSAAASSLLAYAALRNISAGNRSYALPAFEPAPLEPPESAIGDELLLHDALAGIAPDARVVRLFGPSRATGEGAFSSRAGPDDSHALSAALAELRRSLR